MTEVIKMHEQRQASQAYSSLFPNSSPPPPPSQTQQQPSHQTCQPSPCSCHAPPSVHHHRLPCYPSHSQCYSSHHCCTLKTKTDVSDTNQESTTIIKELKLIVAKLQGEIVDVVDKMENLAAGSTSRKSNPASPPPKPLFRNPRDIPAFDAIDELDDEESPEATPVDDSVVSIDEFVPDITVHVPHIQEEHSSLNCNNPTIQPC